ncbi:hypothetical protein NPIRD3C_1958 [Nitrosopumilus piranensis]|uniref:Uncharacterized protein n=1 Tax=Nitrosopumilus piranensis TaxID=1582439 RepID=A0A0C5BTT4_9ARCH|nr:hypothetical protein NPIRD3C_1958 [Nitrosopumilus piranensis]
MLTIKRVLAREREFKSPSRRHFLEYKILYQIINEMKNPTTN